MEDIMKLLEGRRTYRRFKQHPVPKEVLDEILRAARLASSAANRQPLSYVAVQSEETVKEVFSHTRWAGALSNEHGQPKEGERPVLFIGVVKNTDINPDCDTDAGLAIANMTLAAWNRGVGSCIIGACNKEKLSELFGLSEKQKLHTVVAFGFPSHESHIVELEPGGDCRYYLDEKKDYIVPKRRLSDIVKYL